jgi:RHS repeat-associated protein
MDLAKQSLVLRSRHLIGHLRSILQSAQGRCAGTVVQLFEQRPDSLEACPEPSILVQYRRLESTAVTANSGGGKCVRPFRFLKPEGSLSYDAENRLTGVSGAASASFLYDGDGRRVKATFGGSTTAYPSTWLRAGVGDYFEWTGSSSTMVKYYYAPSTGSGQAGQRVAMRQGSTLYYLLGDHLGSTAITANSSGSKSGELRYKAWGENRYTYGSTPTARRFTGQTEDATIGLYFYNARYYDAALGRFVQADTIVPSPADPQSFNRYSYVLNNPLKYVDPSGHVECVGFDAAGRCVREPKPEPSRLWVHFTTDQDPWPDSHKALVIEGASKVGGALSRVLRDENLLLYKSGDISRRGPPITARGTFLRVFGKLTFNRSTQSCTNCWAKTAVPIITVYANTFDTGSTYPQYGHLNTAHELGHAFSQRAGRQPYDSLDATFIRDAADNVIAGGGGTGVYVRRNAGYVLTPTNRDPTWPWQQNTTASASEDFADMFLNWSYQSFDNDRAGAGAARKQWMTVNMPGWIALAVAGN